jgi:dihydroorotase
MPKRPEDRQAIQRAATGTGRENQKFFLGTDNAPHWISKKINSNGCACGVFNAPVALPVVADIFAKRLATRGVFEDFVANRGEAFYGLPASSEQILLRRRVWQVPNQIGRLVPFLANEHLYWEAIPL